jgi:cbb3-type cytochrome oxidase maturation protein
VEVLILTVFISVVFVIGELVFFVWNVHGGSHDHSERLALLPLETESQPPQARGENTTTP